VRAALVAASALLLLLAGTFAPLLLRRIHAFDVARVEVVGAHYLAADEAVKASTITRASNVFDDPNPWLEALLRHPLVAQARIERRVPNTLVLHVTEAVPVAFARTPELRAIDARGRVLPIDAKADLVDLPVLAVDTRVSAQGLAADAETKVAAAFLGSVLRDEPGLLGWISEVDVQHGDVRLVLRSDADVEVLVSPVPDAAKLRELHLTLADLATPRHAAAPQSGDTMATTQAAQPELARVKRIDVRYHDQIVVALHGGES